MGVCILLLKIEAKFICVYYSFSKLCFDMNSECQNSSVTEAARSHLFLSNINVTELFERQQIQKQECWLFFILWGKRHVAR
jgi:hypothetical protein